jgi:hypothetical protein
MPRRVLLLEPNYQNKYPPMGLMKLATYFRERGDDVRFFKGDMRNLAVDLLFEEFWSETYDVALGEFTTEMRTHIKTGKLAPLKSIPDFKNEKKLRAARARYKNGDYPKFDIVAITTLFTFYWKETISTINSAKSFVSSGGRIIIGGIASSILPDEIEKETGIRPYLNDRRGALLDRKGQIDEDSEAVIDELALDYSILEEIDYKYPVSNAYFGYMTRGCVNRCAFCAVPRLEPKYCQYNSIKQQIERTIERFGMRKDLLLLDNNVFASRSFNKIIDEIVKCGFGKSAIYKPSNEYVIAVKNLRDGYNARAYLRKVIKLYDSIVQKLSEAEQGAFYNDREERGLLYTDTATAESVLDFDEVFSPMYEKHVHMKVYASRGRARYVDFNQGVDARLITDKKMEKLAETNIRPLRIAFDYWDTDPQHPTDPPMRETYAAAIRLAAKYNIRDLSNYMLYNSDSDVPYELYLRLRLNIELCEELDVRIYSFPMKYHPIDDPVYFNNRDFIGKAWNRKYIRAVQAVLNSTHGKIGRGKSFFEAAFGKNIDQYHEILIMPEAFIIERHKYDREAYQKYIDGGGTRMVKPDELATCGDYVREWRSKLAALNKRQRKTAEKIIFKNVFTDETCTTGDSAVDYVLRFYRISKTTTSLKLSQRVIVT